MLALFPLYLLYRGVPTPIEFAVLCWFAVPLVVAYFLSRTGRYETAQFLSSLALTGVITLVAAATGGISSFATAWLIAVPLEASVSASRRAVFAAGTLALLALAFLAAIGAFHVVEAPSADAALLAIGAVLAACLGSIALALGAQALLRTGSGLLAAEEDRYRLLAETMTDVITRHAADGAVSFASPAARSMFGASANSLLGHGLFERVHVADRPAYLTALGDAAALGETRAVEFRVRRDSADAEASPAFVWIEMRCQPFDAGCETGVREVVGVLRDVTERHAHEDVLAAARADAERASVAKSRFLATMSHELRTPLNAIIGFSELLTQERVLALDPVRRHEYAGLINESGQHLLAVVNGILDMSKLETGNFVITPEPFAPGKVLKACCEMLALRAAEAGVALDVRVGDDLPEMIGDKRAVNQILLNLLSNAIRFTDRGGRVTVSARVEARALCVVIEDNGVGIRDDDLARVGEPYFQASASHDRRQSGTGLGLSIVMGLVRLHGGEFSIASRLGEGTRVGVRLPLDCEAAKASAMLEGAATERASFTGANVIRHPLATSSSREVVAQHELRVKKRA